MRKILLTILGNLIFLSFGFFFPNILTLNAQEITDFNFSLSNGGDKSVVQGNSVTNSVTATLISEIETTQSISFSVVSDLPASSTASFSSVSCDPTCSTTLTINTLLGTPQGDYTIVVRGATGSLTRDTSFVLSVIFAFSLSNEGDKSVVQGNSVTNSVTATLSPGATIYSLSFSAIHRLPTGVTVSFSPNSCRPTCSTTLTINTLPSVPAGRYTITVRARVGSSLARDTSFTLTVTAIAVFDFSLSNGGDKSVVQGNSVTNSITANLISIAAQPVSFSVVSGLPASSTASFSPVSCDPACSSALTINTLSDTPTQSYAIVVRGATGSLTRDTSFSLTVTSTASPFDFSFSSGGNRLVTQDSAVTNFITATLIAGTTQPVSFSVVSGLPAGATAVFSPDSCSPTCSSNLTINTAASALTGSYTIIVRGAAGSLTRDTSFVLSVESPSLAGGLIPCGGPGEPACQLCHFFVLSKNIIDFLLFRILPSLAALMLVIGGFMYAFAYVGPAELLPGGGKGGPALLGKAKNLLTSVVWGLLIIFAAWVIVNAFFQAIGVADWTGLRQGWWQINCQVAAPSVTTPTTTPPTITPPPTIPPPRTGAITYGTCTGASCRDTNVNICGPATANCAINNLSRWQQEIDQAITRFALPQTLAGGISTRRLVLAIISQETHGNPNAQSSVDSCGLTQLQVSTAVNFASACGATASQVTCQWLKDHPREAICMTIRYLNSGLIATCGSNVKHLAAGYNGGPGACQTSANCGPRAGSGSCSLCQGATPKKWECFWDDDAHTVCNADRIIGGRNNSYAETRAYAPKVEYCYNQF